jgi:AMP phosphorylase
MDLGEDFVELGRRLGMQVECVATYGEQPLGHAVGPALEAREALLTLEGRGPKDLVDKAATLAGTLFKMVGKGDKNLALRILTTGKAKKKMMEIIREQGGDANIKPKDIPLGSERVDVKANTSGKVLWINNHQIAAIAKAAGAPKDKGAGIYLYKKTGDTVKAGEKLFTIFAEKSTKLSSALKLLEEEYPMVIGKGYGEEMLIRKIPEKKRKEVMFILER